MLRNRKLLIFVFILSVIISVLSFSFLLKENPQTPQTEKEPTANSQVISEKTDVTPADENRNYVKVTRVIDGDTIEIEGGAKVRYIGIDTPEINHPQKPIECFAKEAKARNAQLVQGREVRLEKDVSQTDKYGRLLRYVYLPSVTSAKEGIDEIFVNGFLVKEGFAYASSYPPDIKYQDLLNNSQQEAEKANKGFWSSCKSDTQESPSAKTENNNCQIKGNISSSGEKIYHLPGQRYYNKTVIDEEKGEKWFCSEDEALSQGWRKSKI